MLLMWRFSVLTMLPLVGLKDKVSGMNSLSGTFRVNSHCRLKASELKLQIRPPLPEILSLAVGLLKNSSITFPIGSFLILDFRFNVHMESMFI